MKPENDSVFDPLYETLFKKAVRATGMDTPQGQLMAAINPTPLIAKIPFSQVPTRNAELIAAIKARGNSPELVSAVEFAAKKYPRVLAHVQGLEELPPEVGKNLGNLGTHSSRGPLSDITMNPYKLQGEAKMLKKPLQEKVANTFGHELTHAAQNIWNGKSFNPMYRAANEWGGKNTYEPNVFEQGARKAGKNFASKMGVASPDQPGLMQRMMDMFDPSK